MRVLHLASHNAKKIAELQNLVGPAWTIRSAALLTPPVHWDETGDTFAANALIKTRTIWERTRTAVLGDDSGLIVDALDGRPGVYSSRFAGPEASDEDNNGKLVDALAGVPIEDRSARFVCCLAFKDERGNESVFVGTLEGTITLVARGTNGFGYDPHFIPRPDGASKPGGRDERTLAEYSASEKNVISHRAQAMRQFLDAIR